MFVNYNLNTVKWLKVDVNSSILIYLVSKNSVEENCGEHLGQVF